MRRPGNYLTKASFINHYAAFIGFALISAATYATETSSEQARALINDMSRASRELNYDATFVYHKESQMDVMRLLHKNTGEREIERLVSLTGHAREVIRDDKSVTCIFPEDQAVMVEKVRPRKFLSGQLPEPIENIAAYYDFQIAGTDRVLGRDTWIVNIIPRDDFRYGYQLWIDKDSKLSLKTQLKTLQGVTLEQILFTELEILDHMPDEMMKPSVSGSGYTWYNHTYEKKDTRVTDARWNVKWMPVGFSMSNMEQQTIAASDTPVDHMIYSDGLATVSVFVEKIANQPVVEPGPSHMGGVNTFATVAEGFQVTAVGEVPLATVEQMAKSVEQKQ